MAETERPAERQRRPPARKVVVTNTYRNQPILFHVIGGSVRLGPFETRQLDRACLSSPEVSHLVLTGALRVHEPGAAGHESEDGDEAPRQRSTASRHARSTAERQREDDGRDPR